MTSRFTLGISAVLFMLSGVLSFAAAANAAGVDVTKITRGNVSFSQDGNRLVVRASNGSIIEYNRFSVEAGQIMQFIQPSSTSRVLNRVTGAELSRIDGSLLSNGIVYLVNPQGIRIGSGALINVGGFYAAAGAMSDNDFIRGQNNFTNLSGKVTNEGMIQAQSVALIGQYVANHGIINVDDGMVAMAAGDTVYLQNGSAPIMVTVSRSAMGADGSGAGTEAAVTNTGTINAGKGKVAMASGDFYALAMDLSGTIIGKSIEARGGNGGVVAVNGTLDASSSTDKGGTIDLFGDRVGLFGNALVNANGATGGGNVRIGGDYQGKNAEVRNASQTYVAPTAQIYADALTIGNGGNVIVWSDNGTQFYGAASAQAGQLGGNGGFVEVSGKHYLDFRGSVSTNAPKGLKGKLLLDPEDLTINNDGPNNNSGSAQAFNTTGSSAVLTWATIDAALANNDVTVQSSGGAGTGGTITISQAGVLTHTSSLTITAAAGKDIVINASVTNDGSVAAGAGSGVPNITFAVSGAGQIQLGADVTTAGGVVTFDGPVSLIGNAAVDTTNSGGTPVGAGINFLGPLDGGFDFVLTAGTSNITFSGGAVGGVMPLGTVRINSAYNVIMASDFTANAFYQYVGTGITAFFGVINLGAFDFIGSNLEMNGVGTNVADTIDIRQSGNFTLADGANIEVTNTDGYFYQRTYGGTNFIGGNITARTFVGFRSDVVLTGADAVVLTMTNGVAGNYLGFSNITGNGQDLTLASNTEIRVRGNIGTGADTLGDIRILNSVDVNLLGTVDAASFTQDAGSGTTTFNGAQNYTGALGLNVSTNMIAVNALITTATGPITFIGTGGIVVAGNITAGGTGEINITGNTNVDPTLRSTVGVSVNASVTIATTNGDLYITGTGGSSVSGNNYGVANSGTITSIGAGNVIVMGTGGTGGSVSDDLNIGVHNFHGTITSGGGDVTVTGMGGLSGSGFGIYNYSGTIASGGAGNVLVQGTGGSGDNSCGVYNLSNTISSGGLGSVTVTGMSGSGSGVNQQGLINGGTITSGGGDVFVTGTAGYGDGRNVGVDNYGLISSGGVGNVTVEGTTGGSDGYSYGVYNGNTITSGGIGNVTVEGTGGSGSDGFSFGVSNRDTITSGGGNVALIGTGGNGAGGYNLGVYNYGTITSGGGNIALTGTGGSGGSNNDAIYFMADTVITAPRNLELTSLGGAIYQPGADPLIVVGTTTITAGTNDVTLAESTNDFGGAVVVVSANNVLLADINALTLGASTVANDFTATAGGGIVVAGNITAGGTGEINITGNTNVDPDLRSDTGVTVNSGVTIQTTNGDLNITGTGGSVGGYNSGVYNYGTITSGGAGNVVVMGTGGSGAPGYNIGVYNFGPLFGTGGIITSGGIGSVTVTGIGGTGGSNNYGVINSFGLIKSGDSGAVTVTGTGGNGPGGVNLGVLNLRGTITSDGNGSVTVTGMAGSGLGGSNYGVYNYGGTITSGGGDVTVVGIGGTGDGGENYGVANSRTITSIGTGNVIVMGTGGTGGSDNDAIVMDVDSLVAAPGDLALISNGGAINQISGTITVVGATTITANAPNTDIYLNGGPNDFTGTVTIDNTGGAASNVRDFKLRNVNAAAGAVVNLDSATNLRDLTITYNNAGYTLPTLTSLFLRTVSLNINGTLTLGTITGHGDTFNIATANLVLGGTISGLDTMILQNIDPNGDITLFGLGGLEISSSMWTTIQNGATNVQFGSLTNTGSITVAADWENNNNVTMNFLPGGTGHVYVDHGITGTGSLTINGSGNTTTVSADITQTAIHIADAVEVDEPLITLTATAGDITIDGAIIGVNGGESLSLAATGDITLGGDIGNSVGHKLMEFRVDCGNDVGDTITFTQNGQVVAAEIVALNCSNVCIEPGARMMGGDATSTLNAPATMATIVALGDIEFNADDFRFGQNHKLTGFGDITIGGFTAPKSLSVKFGDVNAVGDLRVNANSITLLGRAGGPIATNTGGVVNDPQIDYVVGGRVYFSVAPIMGGSNPGNRAVFSNPTGNVDALGTLGAYSKSVYPTAITSTLLSGAGGATLDLGAASGVSYINPATIIPQAMSSMPPIGLLGDADTLDDEDDAAAPVADDQTTEPISTPTQTEKTATDVPVNAIGTVVPVALR